MIIKLENQKRIQSTFSNFYSFDYNRILSIIDVFKKISSYPFHIKSIHLHKKAQILHCQNESFLCKIRYLMYPYSFSVESSPRTKRKCADDLVYDDACHDVIFGQMSMLACYCKEDFCNTATMVSKTDITKTIFITILSLLIFAH